MSKTVYMIRHKALDLYKTAGTPAHWTRKGKVWNSIGALKNHLNLHRDNAGEFPEFLIEDMKQWEVISIAVTQTELHRFSIPSLYKFP
jgi:hypothetical protein